MPQKFFDLVKSSNFCAPLKPSFVWFTTEHGESGESKAVMSLRERKLWLSQSGLLLCLSIEAFLQHKLFAEAPQSTDFCFYQQYLLLRRILKWALTQKTPKFIVSLKRMTTRTHQHRKVNSYTMRTALIYLLTALWPMKNGQPNEVDADKELERALME